MKSQSTSLPVLSVDQRADMLRAGAATVAEHLAAALPEVLGSALQDLNSRRDADAGALAARQFLSTRRDELKHAYVARLKQEQDGALGRLIKRDKAGVVAPKFTADSLSLVDDDEADHAEIAARAARRMRGSLETESRDIQLLSQYLAGRENIRADDDPFAPEACMKSLLEAARELGLEAGGWDALLGAMERPMADALAHSHAALIERFRGLRLDAAEIRREMSARQALGRAGPGPATLGGATLGPATQSAAALAQANQSTAAQRLAAADDIARVDGFRPMASPGVAGAPDGAALAGLQQEFPGSPAPSAADDVRASFDDFVARLSAEVHGVPGPVALPAAGKPPADLLDAINQMQHLGARAAMPAGPGAAAPAMTAAGDGQATWRDLLGAGPGAGGTPASFLPPAAGTPPGGLFAAINEMQQGGAAAGLPEGMAAVAPSLAAAGIGQEAWRDVLLAKSSRTVDKLTIEIVGVLFEHVLQDNQVPAEIKALLYRLQFPVLKVALTDADFFASSAHPARRMIDRMASTAIGWEPYGDENQRYKEEVERVVQQVLERFDEDTSVFEQLLGEFEAFLAEMPTRETDPIARAKRALEEAETREVLVINTTIQVRRAFEQVELEAYLREFLVGPWVQALVSATLREEQTPGFSKAFRQVIHDVVWSVQPKVSADERKRLVTLIPAMTRVLRDGLGLIGMSESDQLAFFKKLMASHAVAVRPVDQATYIKSRVATGDLRQKLDEMSFSGTVPMNKTLAGGVRVSVNAVKRAAEHHSAQLLIAEPLATAAPLSPEQNAQYDAQVARWERGSWFRLHDGQQTVRVRLRWISPLRTLYMFSSGEQDKGARVLSPEAIKSYLQQGWLEPLEDEPLITRVVERVVDELEHSPKRADALVEKIRATEAPKPH